MKRLNELGITLNPDKCIFKQKSIEFFGMTISNLGIRPNKHKMHDFMQAVCPKSSSEVRSFLGLANYFGNRIPNLATLSAPLRSLTQKSAVFNWTNEHTTAFESIKSALITKCMGHYDVADKTELICDASPVGASTWLLQTDRYGSKRIISCASKAFTSSELNMSHIEKEAFACVWACEHFHIYLYGQRFSLITDNMALITIYNKEKHASFTCSI